MNRQPNKTSRRELLRKTAGAAAAFTIVPRHVLGTERTAPTDKLNIACIGIGGQGGASVGACSNENIVALCDVDENRAGGQFDKFPKARKYRDFRRMFDEMDKQIDAVTVATPDHTHAVACMEAIKRGKHVYCEKPLAHSIYEIRELTKAARKHKVVTQLGSVCEDFRAERLLANTCSTGQSCSVDNSGPNEPLSRYGSSADHDL